MSGKRTQLTSLKTRKQMLLAESELNRVQLLHEWNDLKNEFHLLTSSVRAVGSAAASMTKIGAVFSILFRLLQRKKETEEKKSFTSSLFNGVRTGISLWQTFRGWR